jgi:hypothetical protein
MNDPDATVEETFDPESCIMRSITAARENDMQTALTWALISLALSGMVRSGALERNIALLAREFFTEPNDEVFNELQAMLQALT